MFSSVRRRFCFCLSRVWRHALFSMCGVRLLFRVWREAVFFRLWREAVFFSSVASGFLFSSVALGFSFLCGDRFVSRVWRPVFLFSSMAFFMTEYVFSGQARS